MATNARPSFFAVTAVVPLPENGSNTTSPGSVEARMSFAASFSGFCAGWSVFSGIDQNGTEMSSQKFEAPVRRNFPPDSSLQSFGMPFSRYGAITLRFMRTASAWKIAASSGGATAYQMSSQAFFQLVSAARPFSRCQVMRFRTMKCCRRISKHAALHRQSQHRYTAPPGRTRRFTSGIQPAR